MVRSNSNKRNHIQYIYNFFLADSTKQGFFYETKRNFIRTDKISVIDNSCQMYMFPLYLQASIDTVRLYEIFQDLQETVYTSVSHCSFIRLSLMYEEMPIATENPVRPQSTSTPMRKAPGGVMDKLLFYNPSKLLRTGIESFPRFVVCRIMPMI